MNSFQTTTIGNAFNASFNSSKWEEFSTNKGEQIVHFFSGNISKELHNLAVRNLIGMDPNLINVNNVMQFVPMLSRVALIMGDEKIKQISKGENEMQDLVAILKEFLNNYYWPIGTSAIVQWAISTQGDSFQLKAMSCEAWEGQEMDTILEYYLQFEIF